jgi:hypothetical protein
MVICFDVSLELNDTPLLRFRKSSPALQLPLPPLAVPLEVLNWTEELEPVPERVIVKVAMLLPPFPSVVVTSLMESVRLWAKTTSERINTKQHKRNKRRDLDFIDLFSVVAIFRRSWSKFCAVGCTQNGSRIRYGRIETPATRIVFSTT